MKPTKKQKAIIALLNKIDTDGLELTAAHYGIEELTKKIDDEKLVILLTAYEEAVVKLDTYLMKLEEQVEPFRDDDLDF